jgi:uncharacterized OB-fold protein
MPSRNSAFFWEGVQRGELLGQRCCGCSRFRHPPRPMCPHCNSLEWEAIPLSGRGSVYAWIKPVHPPLPMFEEGFLVALIELEEGIRLLSNVEGTTADEIENGMAVEVCYAETADGGAVPIFRPLRERGA